MSAQAVTFSSLLSGETAFYKQPEYSRKDETDISRPSAITYRWQSSCKMVRFVKQIVPTLTGYQALHALVGKALVMSSSLEHDSAVFLGEKWHCKRIRIVVDDCEIDGMIVGKESTLSNRKWTLLTVGNGEFYEESLNDENFFMDMLERLQSNAIAFNYPGVGLSSGVPDRKAMKNAYRATLRFLEDKQKGIGAETIMGYGHSLGGAIQAEALRHYPLKAEIKYVFVKSKTFSSLAPLVARLIRHKIAHPGIILLGWNVSAVASSKALRAPEIIVQTAHVTSHEELENSDKIISDGVIEKKESLAQRLLDDESCSKENKTFIGVHEKHNDGLEDVSFLVGAIEAYLDISK